MSRSNRDHAKKKHRPMVEDGAIASLARSFIDTCYYLPRKLLPSTGVKRQNSQPTVDGSGGINPTLAGRSGSHATDKNTSQGGFSLV